MCPLFSASASQILPCRFCITTPCVLTYTYPQSLLYPSSCGLYFVSAFLNHFSLELSQVCVILYPSPSLSFSFSRLSLSPQVTVALNTKAILDIHIQPGSIGDSAAFISSGVAAKLAPGLRMLGDYAFQGHETIVTQHS